MGQGSTVMGSTRTALCPAGSVALAVKLWLPSDIVPLVVNDQLPLPWISSRSMASTIWPCPL